MLLMLMLLLLLQDVAIKSLPAVDGDPDVLEYECRLLQQLSRVPSVPRVVGWCSDAQGRRALAMEPVGMPLQLDTWDGMSTSKAPLHTLVGALVGALKRAHARGILNRDVRPSNMILTDGEQPQLHIIDWGFAVRCEKGSKSYRGPYCGTLSYASCSVLQQRIAGTAGGVEVSAADDLVSLVRSLYALQHPAAQEQLRVLPRADAAAALQFWDDALASRPRWREAVAAAAAAKYGRVRKLLQDLLE
jgi:hypothetical protein